MSSPEDGAAIHAKLRAQTNEIHEGIVQVTMAWSYIESSMAMLLAKVLKDAEGEIASAIYFSPGSSEVRFKIVDYAFRELCGRSKTEPETFEILIAPWQVVLKQLKRLKGVRNKVAHGQVSSVARFGKNHVRLTPPFFHFAPMVDAHRARQLPGLSGNDIKQSAAKMWALAQTIDLFLPIAKAIHAKDEAALQQALLAAAASLTKAPPQPGDPTPPKPESQPQSPPAEE